MATRYRLSTLGWLEDILGMNKAVIAAFFVLTQLVIVSGISYSAGQRPSPQSAGGYGNIEGIVITKEGRPLANASVYIFQTGGSPVRTTSETGRFEFTGVSVGKHLILAYKESDGFPNPVWSFYSEAPGAPTFPVAEVRENQTIRGIVVRLGPRSSRLLISLVDATTKRAIIDAEVTMNYVSKPKTLLRSGPNQSQDGFIFGLLVPALVPINLQVAAPGYKNWRYKDNGAFRAGNVLLLKPGTERRITVELQPINRN
jgi:hypothetical protein